MKKLAFLFLFLASFANAQNFPGPFKQNVDGSLDTGSITSSGNLAVIANGAIKLNSASAIVANIPASITNAFMATTPSGNGLYIDDYGPDLGWFDNPKGNSYLNFAEDGSNGNTRLNSDGVLYLSSGKESVAVSGVTNVSLSAGTAVTINAPTITVSQDPASAPEIATKNYVDTHPGNILSGFVTFANALTTPVTVAITGVSATSKCTMGERGTAVASSFGYTASTNQIIFNGTFAGAATIAYIVVP